MLSAPTSSIDRLASRLRIPWYGFVTLLAGALLLLAAVTVYFDGILEEVLHEGAWRYLVTGPAITVYILALFPLASRYQGRALEALRPVILLDDEAFMDLAESASRINASAELLAFGVGAVFGFVTNAPWTIPEDYSWLRFYIPFVAMLMFGLLAWLSYVAIAGTRLYSELHRQPLEIDIFELGPFEPIGRHALFTSLAFIGGCVISVLILNPLAGGPNVVSLVQYGLLAVVTILVFFLSMRPTHTALARVKGRELKLAEKKIADTFRELKLTESEGKPVDAVATRLNLWLRYEDRVKKARTWPYNTPMLRTLFFSVLVPAIVSLVQRVIAIMLAS
jgi:hypothetical protein